MQPVSFSLAGRKAIVVGADSGIGVACSHALAAAGASLVMSGLHKDAGEARAADIARETGSDVTFLPVDVRDEAAMADMHARAVARLGGLDIALNNAGVAGPIGPLQDTTIEDFDALFAINVRGQWLGMKYQVPHMLEAGRGSIINLSSIAGLIGQSYTIAYAGSKHAVVGMTKSAAIELGSRNIRVNAIAPGPVETGLLHEVRGARQQIPGVTGSRPPMERVAAPEEMAGTVVWLASDASSYVTGAVISVDGGVVAM